MGLDETHEPQPVSVRRRGGGRPRGPLKMSEPERREALDYWRKVGVLDERGRPTDAWHKAVGRFVA